MIGLGGWGIKIFHAAASDRNTFKIVNLIVFAIGASNCLGIIFDLHERHGLCEFKQFISWMTLSIFFNFYHSIAFNFKVSFFAVLSFMLPTLSANSFRDRFMAIISSLALPFSLMSLSYEPLFFMTFTSSIYYWVSMIYTERKQMYTVSAIDC